MYELNWLSEFGTAQKWVLASVGLPLFILYATALLLTSYNLHEVKGRIHTKVLLRTQVMLILIESLRLATAACCCI